MTTLETVATRKKQPNLRERDCALREAALRPAALRDPWDRYHADLPTESNLV
jgi:hypothetical protein